MINSFLTHALIGAAIITAPTVVEATAVQDLVVLPMNVAPVRPQLTDSQPLSGHSFGDRAPEGALDVIVGSKMPATSPIWAVDHRSWIDAAVRRLASLRGGISKEVTFDLQSSASFAVDDCHVLLLKLALAGLDTRPSIGWDSDGSLALYVASQDFSADMSIFGNGTYSLAAKRGEASAFLWEGALGGPLPKALTEMLA